MKAFVDWWRSRPGLQRDGRVLIASGLAVSLLTGLGFGTLRGAGIGMLVGLGIGLANILRVRMQGGEDTEVPQAYAEPGQRVEKRQLMLEYILLLGFPLVGIGASWVMFGTGIYGVLPGLAAALAAIWVLGRPGAPAGTK